MVRIPNRKYKYFYASRNFKQIPVFYVYIYVTALTQAYMMVLYETQFDKQPSTVLP